MLYFVLWLFWMFGLFIDLLVGRVCGWIGGWGLGVLQGVWRFAGCLVFGFVGGFVGCYLLVVAVCVWLLI